MRIIKFRGWHTGKKQRWLLENEKLPENVLPRHADSRDNVIDLCKAVNALISYLRAREKASSR